MAASNRVSPAQIAGERDSANLAKGKFQPWSAREEDPWTTSKPHHSLP
jgi:hypothetical protein